MAKERTLSIVKPDGVQKNLIGECLRRFEKAGLKVIGTRMLKLSRTQAEEFYSIHKGKPFYEPLVSYMISGPVVVSVLEGEDAIQKHREIMGATDPKKAEPGTIRRDFADSIDANVVHGSDAPETAKAEAAFFFKPEELFSR